MKVPRIFKISHQIRQNSATIEQDLFDKVTVVETTFHWGQIQCIPFLMPGMIFGNSYREFYSIRLLTSYYPWQKEYQPTEMTSELISQLPLPTLNFRELMSKLPTPMSLAGVLVEWNSLPMPTLIFPEVATRTNTSTGDFNLLELDR